jgi:hypothetical protein
MRSSWRRERQGVDEHDSHFSDRPRPCREVRLAVVAAPRARCGHDQPVTCSPKSPFFETGGTVYECLSALAAVGRMGSIGQQSATFLPFSLERSRTAAFLFSERVLCALSGLMTFSWAMTAIGNASLLGDFPPGSAPPPKPASRNFLIQDSVEGLLAKNLTDSSVPRAVSGVNWERPFARNAENAEADIRHATIPKPSRYRRPVR